MPISARVGTKRHSRSLILQPGGSAWISACQAAAPRMKTVPAPRPNSMFQVLPGCGVFMRSFLEKALDLFQPVGAGLRDLAHEAGDGEVAKIVQDLPYTFLGRFP